MLKNYTAQHSLSLWPSGDLSVGMVKNPYRVSEGNTLIKGVVNCVRTAGHISTRKEPRRLQRTLG